MQYRTFHDDDRRMIVAVFDTGDDPVPMLDELAAKEGVLGASLSAVGAFRWAELGYFDPERCEYLRNRVEEQVEVLSILGDIADDGGEPATHVHAVLGRRDSSTVGGHLLHGEVWPTLEVIISELPAGLRKRHDPATGLSLLDVQHAEER